MKIKTWILGGLAAAAGVALLSWAFAPRLKPTNKRAMMIFVFYIS